MDVSLTTDVMAIFVFFGQFLAKIWLPWQRALDPYNQKYLIRNGRPQTPPVISNRIIVIYRRTAFMCIYRNFCPKIGCHGNAPLSLVYGSVTDKFPDGINPISKPNSAWICRLQLKLWPFIFVIFWPILAKIWLPWQRPLDPCNQKYLIWIGRPRKPPFISNSILVISRRNAFTCIYSNFGPKIGCHGNAPLSLVYGSITDEFPDGTNPISKPNCMEMSLTTEVMAIFVIFFTYFGQNLVAMATSLRPLQSEMSYLDWLSPKTIP